MAQDSEHSENACIQGIDLLGCGKVARRLRPVGLLFSMALHVAVVAGGVWLAVVVPHTEFPVGVYEVEIVRPEPPQPAEKAEPEAAPVPPAAAEKGQVARQEAAPAAPPAAAAPQPAPGPAGDALDLVAPARSAEALPPEVAATAPAEPGALDIAPRQEPAAAPESPAEPGDSEPVVGVVQKAGETDVGGLRGFAGQADTFALDRLAREEFTLREFAGFYRVQGQPDRYLVLVDALASRGRLLLLDRHSDFLRPLKQRSTMVYSYGAAGGGDEPVQGVIYLMPRKARYANENINLPHQLVWMRDTPPALVAEMVRIREAQVVLRAGERELRGLVAMPMGPGPFPGVVWLPGGCEPAAVREGFARSLAVRGLAALVFDYPGCADASGATRRVTLDDLARDAGAALAELRQRAGVDAARCGLWGRDKGIWVALRAAARAAAGQEPAFVVAAAAAVGDGDAPPLALPEADARAARVPQLWLLSAPDPVRTWRQAYRFLDGLAAAGRPVAATLYPEESAPPHDEAAALSRQLMPWHEDLGVRWVLRGKRNG